MTNNHTINTYHPNGGRIHELDGLRGIAVITVMVFHFTTTGLFVDKNPMWYIFKQGFYGIDIFFVLSGYLITGILVHERDKTKYFKNFYVRRFLRIMPLYYFALLITFTSGYWLEGLEHYYRLPYNSPVWPVFFITNISITLSGHYPFYSHIFDIGHFWSLAVEEQFYLMWPVVIYICPRRYWVSALVLLMVVSPLTRWWIQLHVDHSHYAAYMLTICRFDGFAIGGLLVVLQSKIRHIPTWRIMIGSLICLTVLASSGDFLWRTFISGCAAFLIFLCIGPFPKIKKIMGWRPITYLGQISYGLYVYHHLLIKLYRDSFGKWLANHLSDNSALILFLLISTSISIILAHVSWKCFEKPILRLKKHFPYHMKPANKAKLSLPNNKPVP